MKNRESKSARTFWQHLWAQKCLIWMHQPRCHIRKTKRQTNIHLCIYWKNKQLITFIQKSPSGIWSNMHRHFWDVPPPINTRQKYIQYKLWEEGYVTYYVGILYTHCTSDSLYISCCTITLIDYIVLTHYTFLTIDFLISIKIKGSFFFSLPVRVKPSTRNLSLTENYI